MDFQQSILIIIITALVTLIFNTIFHTVKNKFDWLNDTKKFKREYYYKQLEELYIPLYAIIAQSEFFRRFYNLENKSFEEVPFIELSSTESQVTTDLEQKTISRKEVKVSDVITEFNKEKLVTLIIDKGVYASQDLIKLAVAYRYVNKYYEDETIPTEQLENFQKQEIDLIRKIVKLIIKESNLKLKECNMPYNEHEIEQSIMIMQDGTKDY